MIVNYYYYIELFSIHVDIFYHFDYKFVLYGPNCFGVVGVTKLNHKTNALLFCAYTMFCTSIDHSNNIFNVYSI